MRTHTRAQNAARAPWLGALVMVVCASACDGSPVVGAQRPYDAGGDALDDLAQDVAVDKTPPADAPIDAPADAMMLRCASNTDCVGNPVGTTCNPMTGMCVPPCRAANDCTTNPAGNICDATSGLCTSRCAGHMDCAASMAGNVCNPMTNMCVARCTANNDCVAHPGGTVCNTMSGACVAPCRANSDCAMNPAGAVCDTMTGLCGSRCRSHADCAGTMNTVCSATTMTCVDRCATAMDCAGHPDGTVCYTMTGRCAMPCRANGDCAMNPAGAVCDTTTGLCGSRCRSHMDCAGMGGGVCSPSTGMCIDRCAASADCMGHPGGTVCDTTAGRCVACVATADTCPPDQHCDATSNTCARGCRADEGCPREVAPDGGMGAQLRCNTMTRACEQCVTDAHCPTGQRCSSGACVAGCTDDSRCATGERCCGGACVDPRSNDQNCGMCGNRCAATNGDPGCEMGACTIARCTAPFADCDMTVSSGCETNTNTTVTHCGMCGNACPARANATPTCVAGACRFACATGFADCNGDPGDGCEADTRTSVTNCGTCGRSCSVANATAGCAMGACTVASCNAGFADCDGMASNGCEVNTNDTVAHCGRCGNACADPPRGTATCSSGSCALAACDTGFADCNATLSDGCEVNLNTSAASCGACGRACSVTNGTPACAGGVCAVGSCNPGFADCDGTASNGCETALDTTPSHCGRCGNACAVANGVAGCAGGGCTVATCNSGFADCNRSPGDGCEVNTLTDANNCSTCGNVCRVPGGTNACARGTCIVSTCTAPLGDCDGNPTNGCETNLSSALAHCGACGVACSTPTNGVAACASGACGIASCNAPFANCDGNPINGCEVNTSNTVAHCGRCSSPCPARANSVTSCAAGACAYACATGFADCDGNAANGCETNITSDVGNCGACRTVCRPATGGGAVCTGGTCGQTCPTGQTNCSGTCRATATDPSNCGSCGRACTFANATGTCSGGVCSIGSCNTGFGNCDSNPTNGCETDIRSSFSHCGRCGNACAAPTGGTASCVSSACTASCPSGQSNCSGTCRNLATDPGNCGSCGNNCGTGASCTNCSVCSCTSSTCRSGLSGSGSNGMSGGRCIQNFTFSVVAGRRYTISTLGSYSGDPYVVVSGACSCRNDDTCGLGAQCTCTATSTGTATLCASTFSSAAATWNYTVRSCSSC